MPLGKGLVQLKLVVGLAVLKLLLLAHRTASQRGCSKMAHKPFRVPYRFKRAVGRFREQTQKVRRTKGCVLKYQVKYHAPLFVEIKYKHSLIYYF